MATPLVRIPQPQGGTMYAFASAARDITRAFNNPDIKFEFSKYALLDLPDFTDPAAGANTIRFQNLSLASGSSYPATQGANVDFAQTLQNYALNLEELLLQDDDFDPVLLQSDAEKIFFKWLSSLGAIRFETADSNESVYGYHYVEESNATLTGQNYDRVVKYLGTIDAENDVAYRGNTYHEIYVNVPSSVGTTPTVLFKPGNYNNSSNLIYADSQISGRSGQIHPDPSMDLNSVVDGTTGNSTPYYDINPNSTNNVGIEFDETQYHGIANYSDVNNMVEFSQKGQDFRFNAVLLYYDMYSESVPENRSTNLYGILILDDVQSSYGPGSKIHEQIKYKPNEITGLNGNAFALKLNLKFNTSLDNVGVETNINDFTTFSMDLFLDTTTLLENATELLINANSRYSNIADRMLELERLVFATEDQEEILQRVADLEESFQNASIALQDSDSLLKLITNAHNKLNQLIDGTIPVELQYNTDILFKGNGIELDKSVPNKIKVNNAVYGYNTHGVYLWNINSATLSSQLTPADPFIPNDVEINATSYGIWTKLKPYTNRMSLSNVIGENSIDVPVFESDLNIYIDNTTFNWKAGQTFKISMGQIDLGTNSIKIWTDAASGFETSVAEIEYTDLLSDRPYIELVCVDPATKYFEADVIR